MKIIRIHIEQFGTLSDLTMDFSDGYNRICQENGWGKTTLSVFIRVMFYGFARKGERAKDREKYRPWAMGKYGGSLTFSQDDHVYTVYRFFGKSKSGAADEFCLIDEETRKECPRWSSELGEELFGINEESFVSSAWIRRDACLVTSDITSKLGGSQMLLEDVKNYDRAAEELSKRLNYLSPDRKTGVIYRKQIEQQELEIEIRRIPSLDRAIQQMEEKVRTLGGAFRKNEVRQAKLQELLKENSKEELPVSGVQDKSSFRELSARKYYACIALGALLLIAAFLLSVSVKGKGIVFFLLGTALALYGGICLFRKNSDSGKMAGAEIQKSFSRIQTMRELNEQMSLLNKENRELLLDIQELGQRLEELQEAREDLVTKEERLDALKTELEQLKQEYRLTGITARCLAEAKDSFSAKFMDTIQRAFLRYYAEIDTEQKEDLYIDSGYRICAMGGGLPRTEEVLSSGYRALANLCLRLALLDAMYEKERPCIILDDPFIEFDDEKYDRAVSLLKMISDRYQILYISCREKR